MSTETYFIKPVKMQKIEARYGASFQDLDSELMRQGRSDQWIADHFEISINTLKDYRRLLGVRPARCLVPAG